MVAEVGEDDGSGGRGVNYFRCGICGRHKRPTQPRNPLGSTVAALQDTTTMPQLTS